MVIGDPPSSIGLDVLAEAGHPVVELALDDPLQLGRQVLLWEFATAICGAVLGINPFDQPNVAEAKEATKKVLASGPPDIPVTPLADLLGQVSRGRLRRRAGVRRSGRPGGRAAAGGPHRSSATSCTVATTFGLGPRFLHSTGQLHKGGPPTGVFVQVVGADHDRRRRSPARPSRSPSWSTLRPTATS